MFFFSFCFWKTLERISILLTLWFRYLQTCINKSFNVSSWSTFLQNYKKNSKILRKSEKNAFYSNPRHVTTELSKQWRNWIFGENGCRRKYLTLSLRRPLSYRNQSIDLLYMITASVMKELKPEKHPLANVFQNRFS